MNTTQPRIIDREQEIIFTNWTGEDFEHTWNKKIYRFKAQKSYYLPFYLAEHFGRHLVQREINRKASEEIHSIRSIDPRIDMKEVERREQAILNNASLRQEYMDKCVIVTNPENVGIVTPREASTREVKLKADERREHYIEENMIAPGDVPSRSQSKGSAQATQVADSKDDAQFEEPGA